MNEPIPPPPPPGYARTKATKAPTLVGDSVKLSDEQQLAVKRILDDDYEVMVLTGCAGAGKSTVANYLMRNYKMSCCATTGKASVVNGSFWTADMMFGFSRDTWQVDAQRAARGIGRRNVSETIQVDEGSMVGDKMLGAMLGAARRYQKRIVLVGDWAQAKPVNDGWVTKHPDFNKEHVIRLMDCHRQSDRDLIDSLNDVRRGIASDLAGRVFKSRIVAECPDAPGIIRMVATNREADSLNSKHLGKLLDRTRGYPVKLMCTAQDIRDIETQEKWPLKPSYYVQQKENSGFANGEEIAVGAQVMFTANARVTNMNRSEEEDFIPDREYVNGDVGIIEEIWYSITEEVEEINAPAVGDPLSPFLVPRSVMTVEKEPVALSRVPPSTYNLPSKFLRYIDIRLTRNGELIRVYRHRIEVLDTNRNPKLAIVGWPFQLGWAATIHKTQGMTVDKAWIDIGSIHRMRPESRHGLAYVGLSRTRTLEGLFLGSWDPSVIVCDPEVKDLI